MQVKLNESFWNEIQSHYAKSMTQETFELGDIHCWAFLASGNEFPGVERNRRLFEFCKPSGIPVYAYVNEDENTPDIAFDTLEFAFVRLLSDREEVEIITKHSTETREGSQVECEDCSC